MLYEVITETLLRGARFSQLVKRAFGFDDQLFRLDPHLDLLCRGREILAEADQLAPQREVMDHLRIVARRIGRDRRAGETRQISYNFV